MFNTDLYLPDALAALSPLLGPDVAIEELGRVFRSKQLRSTPAFAFDYGDAEINWETGEVTLSQTKRTFKPLIRRDDFNSVFLLVQPPTPADELARLFENYDELVIDVSGAGLGFFEGHLKRWLSFLDGATIFARPILQQLEQSVHFPTWIEKYGSGGLGSHNLAIEWPDDQKERLGIQILLMRKFAQGEIDAKSFGAQKLGAGDARGGIDIITRQIFQPLARELKRYLKDNADWNHLNAASSPAPDRVVKLDHSSGEYIKVVEGLDHVETTLSGLNEYIDPEEREQRLAEIKAGKSLLESHQVRYDAATSVVGGVLKWGARFAAEKVGADLITAALHALRGMLGL